MSKEQQAYIITGASSDLGEAFARYLSKNKDNKLLLTSRRKPNYFGTLNNDNIKFLPDKDLTKKEHLDELEAQIINFIPTKFHVINCVGLFTDYKEFIDMGDDEIDDIINSNLLSLSKVARRLVPLMRDRNGGHFIGFTTHTSYQHYPNIALYTAAKEAVKSLFLSLSNEYYKNRIIFNTFALATLNTDAEFIKKPKGKREDWLKTDDVCAYVDYHLFACPDNLKLSPPMHIDLYEYSEDYFHKSYFDRIDKK